VIPDNNFTILANTFTIRTNTFTILTNTKQYLPIPNNTRQTWYQLVLPGIDKASSMTAKKIPVLSRYHHDMVLTVFLPSGIIAVPIMVIFEKPSMLTMLRLFSKHLH
jgi:hypothetical protein